MSLAETVEPFAYRAAPVDDWQALASYENNDLNGEYLLPEHLRSLGYTTFHTGKWHNGESSWLRAFDKATPYSLVVCQITQSASQKANADRKLTPLPPTVGFSSELFCKQLDSFSREPTGWQTVFSLKQRLQLPMIRGNLRHPSVNTIIKNRPPLPKNFMPQHPFDNGMMVNLRDENLAAWPRDRDVLSDQLAEYYGMIEHLDGQIGRFSIRLYQRPRQKHDRGIRRRQWARARKPWDCWGSKVCTNTVCVYASHCRSWSSIGESKSFCYLMTFSTLCELNSHGTSVHCDGKSLVGVMNYLITKFGKTYSFLFSTSNEPCRGPLEADRLSQDSAHAVVRSARGS